MGDNEELSLGKEDRLPWLEPADDEPDIDAIDRGKIAGFVIALLTVIGLLVAGIWWLQTQESRPNGTGALITAPTGPYKTRPKDAGGMDVEGQGDAAFAASEGADADGRLDLSAQPEAPLTGPRPAAITAEAPVAIGQKASAPVEVGGKLVPPKATVAPARPIAAAKPEKPAAGLIQLGAYGSEIAANQALATLSKRFSFIANMPKTVSQTRVGDKILYRLRLSAGAAAQESCAKLKAGGVSCDIVK